MEVFVERTGQTVHEENFSGTVAELLSKLDVLADEVLVIKNGTLVTEDEILQPSDAIKLLSVISGG